MSRFTLLSYSLLLAAAGLRAQDSPSQADWPTFRGSVQRLGYYPQFPAGQLKLAWRKELWRELTGPRAEVIIAEDLCFLGSYAGKFRAWRLDNGEPAWEFSTGGPIGHSAAYERRWTQMNADGSGTVYFGSMDRKLYALEAATGKLRWNYETGEGIWVAPLVWRDKVMFGGRDGVFCCLDATTGKEIWSFGTGDRILTTASVSEDGDRAIFASEDMHVYCLAVSDGRLLWRSRKLAGLSVRDYAPVIYRGLVFITTNPAKDFHAILGEHQNMLIARTGFKGKDDRYIPGTPEDVKAEQDFILNFLRQKPEEQTFYAFNVSDGKEPWIAPILYCGGLHNPLTPPCVNPETGEVFTQVRSAYGVWDGGGEVRPYTGVGRLDLETGRVELIEHAHRSKEPGRPAGRKDMPWMTFNTIGDETQTLGCAPGLLLSIHQGFIGSMDLKTGLTVNLYGKRDTYGGFYGPGNFGWENQGGYQKAAAAGQPFGIVNEWHGPARSLVSVAGNRVIFHVGSQVLCLEGKP